jgi:hypothetical protein
VTRPEEPMADDKAKKPKIDLKARLGKTTQMGMGGPGVVPTPAPSGPGATPPPPPSDPLARSPSAPAPPPSRPGSSVPAPPIGIAPPPGLSPGIPLPAFGAPARRQAEPKQSAQQQTIKVEIGEEIHTERKKARRNAMFAAFAGALVGLGLGFVAGGSSEKGDRAKGAARGAQLLEKDVKTATDKLKELDTKLQESAEKLKNKGFPDDLVGALGGLTIPFDDTNLDGKGVNGMPSRLFRLVLDYTDGCKNANKLRESLRNLAGMTKDPITKAWKEETSPVANFSVVFHSEGQKQGVAAELVPNHTPFEWKKDWAEKYKVTKLEGGKPAEKEVKRYVKGDLPGNDPVAIPVDPKTTAAFTSDVMLGRLNKAIYDLRVELEGNKENPTNETPGIIKSGEDLANELHKASLNQ